MVPDPPIVVNIFATVASTTFWPPSRLPLPILGPVRTSSHRRSRSRHSLAQHLILQSQLSKTMSQYSAQSYGQGQQAAPQYGGQQESFGYGGQQGSSQIEGRQDPSHYGAQDEQSQYAGQQAPLQYAAQQEQSQDGQPPGRSSNYQQDNSNGQGSAAQPDFGQEGHSRQQSQSGRSPGGVGKPIGATSSSPKIAEAHKRLVEEHEERGFEHKTNGYDHSQHVLRHDEADRTMAKAAVNGAVQQHKPAQGGRINGRGYHHTHLNTLHHMGKTASRSLLHTIMKRDFADEEKRQRLHARAHRLPFASRNLRRRCSSQYTWTCAHGASSRGMMVRWSRSYR